MIYRKQKNFDEKISLLGFGSMRFPVDENNEIDENQVREMVEVAMKNGITYYDHAWFYHNYKSESLMGKILSEYDRSTFYITDKMPLWECKSEEEVDQLFEQQLVNLQTDYIDFYFIHALDKNKIKMFHEFNMPKHIEKWKSEGKIRHIGFSYHDDLETFPVAVDLYDWEFAMIQLNYVDIEHQQGMSGYELLKEKGITTMIMEPVKGGNLAGFNDKINKMYTDFDSESSIASWAIKWVANLDNVAVVLSGMSNLEQLKDNLSTIKNFKPLTNEEITLIQNVKTEIDNHVKVNCTGCNYCMPCPLDVNIPKSFAVLNDYSMYDNEKTLKWSFSLLHRDKQLPSQCVDCGKCIPLCPQGLQIPELLKEVEAIDPT